MSSRELTRSIANEFAKNLPLQIDYLTQMTSILGLGNSVLTRKQINIKHKNINSFWKTNKNEFIKAMYKIDSQNICYEPIWQYFIIKRNIIAKFNYTDTDNKPLFNYTVEKFDCKKII